MAEPAGRGSVLRGTYSDKRSLGPRDLAALRPASPRPRRPRGPAAPAPETGHGIACFCGERFGEGQALDFMLHLRAEVGEDLRLLRNVRRWRAATASRPEYRARQAAAARERRATDPEWRDERNRKGREYKARPEVRERRRKLDAERYAAQAADPERRERRNAAQRARREAAGQPCGCGCGEMTRAGRPFRPGHHQRWLR